MSVIPQIPSIQATVQDVSSMQVAQTFDNIYSQAFSPLAEAQPLPMNLSTEYWTPIEKGETRRLYFTELRQEESTDMQSGEPIDITVAYFIDSTGGSNKIIRNASKRLVSVIEMFNVKAGTPLEICYNGKEKNKNNAFSSDTWSVHPLMLK